MFTIYLTTNLRKSVVANVESIEAAERFLAGWGDIVLFELDADNEGCADCCLLRKSGALDIFAIESN